MCLTLLRNSPEVNKLPKIWNSPSAAPQRGQPKGATLKNVKQISTRILSAVFAQGENVNNRQRVVKIIFDIFDIFRGSESAWWRECQGGAKRVRGREDITRRPLTEKSFPPPLLGMFFCSLFLLLSLSISLFLFLSLSSLLSVSLALSISRLSLAANGKEFSEGSFPPF